MSDFYLFLLKILLFSKQEVGAAAFMQNIMLKNLMLLKDADFGMKMVLKMG